MKEKKNILLEKCEKPTVCAVFAQCAISFGLKIE